MFCIILYVFREYKFNRLILYCSTIICMFSRSVYIWREKDTSGLTVCITIICHLIAYCCIRYLIYQAKAPILGRFLFVQGQLPYHVTTKLYTSSLLHEQLIVLVHFDQLHQVPIYLITSFLCHGALATYSRIFNSCKPKPSKIFSWSLSYILLLGSLPPLNKSSYDLISQILKVSSCQHTSYLSPTNIVNLIVQCRMTHVLMN